MKFLGKPASERNTKGQNKMQKSSSSFWRSLRSPLGSCMGRFRGILSPNCGRRVASRRCLDRGACSKEPPRSQGLLSRTARAPSVFWPTFLVMVHRSWPLKSAGPWERLTAS